MRDLVGPEVTKSVSLDAQMEGFVFEAVQRLFFEETKQQRKTAPKELVIQSYHVGLLSVRRLCSPSLSDLCTVDTSHLSLKVHMFSCGTMCLETHFFSLNTFINE